MRYLAIIVLLVTIAACGHKQPVSPPVPIPKEASTLSWIRDNESDIEKYTVYACWTKDCTNLKAIGTVAQTTIGVRPEFTLYLVGKVGMVAVTTWDTSGNESVFSVPINFDRR